MRWSVVAAVVMCGLAGCAAITPLDVRQDGAAADLRLKGDYKVAGNCLLRQLEYQPRSASTNNAIWDDAGKSAEIISKWERSAIVVADIRQAGDATVGRVFTQGDLRGVLKLFEPCS